MKKLVPGLLLALAALHANAAVLTQLNPQRSQINFTSKQMGVTADGRFTKFDAQLAIDPAHPEAGKARIDVELASVDAGGPEATGEVKGKAWFNTAAFPKASFVATKIRALGGGRYEALGNLSIKGITQPTTATFTLRQEAPGAWVEGGFVLPRLQFKIGEGEWADTATVANEVNVRFKLFAVPGK